MSLSGLKRLLVGKSLPTSAHAEERLSNSAALAVLSSDALSSVAYATEEILLVLVAAGSTALGYSIPIAATIMLLLGIVILSYSQTIKAYPNGGGSYIVARENLGLLPGLVAGGSLMIDYILTVTVSVSAGTAALFESDAGPGCVVGSVPAASRVKSDCFRARAAGVGSEVCIGICVGGLSCGGAATTIWFQPVSANFIVARGPALARVGRNVTPFVFGRTRRMRTGL